MTTKTDRHGNAVAREGVDRCWCGCKYWEHDRCVDCDTPIQRVLPLDDERGMVTR